MYKNDTSKPHDSGKVHQNSLNSTLENDGSPTLGLIQSRSCAFQMSALATVTARTHKADTVCIYQTPALLCQTVSDPLPKKKFPKIFYKPPCTMDFIETRHRMGAGWLGSVCMKTSVKNLTQGH